MLNQKKRKEKIQIFTTYYELINKCDFIYDIIAHQNSRDQSMKSKLAI